MSTVVTEPASSAAPRSSRILNLIVVAAAIGTVVQIGSMAVFVFTKVDSPVMRAVIGMALGLFLSWIVVGGTLGFIYRDRVRAWMLGLRGPWQLKFVLFSIAMALMEEVCTVTLTNCAPLFGVKMGEAYITASANYLDVVALHSVVVFVPQYIAWAWLLSRYDLSPTAVFLMYGVQGLLGEVMFSGGKGWLEVWWIFIYGLMVYLPAYSIPTNRGARRVDWKIVWYLLVLLVSPGPVAGLVFWLHPVKMHFPPIHM